MIVYGRKIKSWFDFFKLLANIPYLLKGHMTNGVAAYKHVDKELPERTRHGIDNGVGGKIEEILGIRQKPRAVDDTFRKVKIIAGKNQMIVRGISLDILEDFGNNTGIVGYRKGSEQIQLFIDFRTSDPIFQKILKENSKISHKQQEYEITKDLGNFVLARHFPHGAPVYGVFKKDASNLINLTENCSISMPDMVEAYFHNGRTYLILGKYGTKVLGHYLFEITDDTKLREIRFPQSKGEEIVAMKLKDGGGDLIVEAEVTPKVRGIRFQTGCYEYFKISNGKSTKIHDTFTYEDPTINKWAGEGAMKGIHLKDTKKAYG